MVTCVTFRVEISLKILYNFFKLILLVPIFISYVGPIVVQGVFYRPENVWLRVSQTLDKDFQLGRIFYICV